MKLNGKNTRVRKIHKAIRDEKSTYKITKKIATYFNIKQMSRKWNKEINLKTI